MKKENFESIEVDFRVWDLQNKFTPFEAACLWLNIKPARKISEESLKYEVIKMREYLEEAAKEGKIEYATKPQTINRWGTSWVRYNSTERRIISTTRISPEFTRRGLRAYAESIKQRPLFLFPEDREPAKKNVFPCPPETKWEDITITLIADDTVRIKTPLGEGRYSYHKLGMYDGRTGDKPTVIWEMLKIFLKDKGIISRDNPKYDPKLPDTVRRLNGHLQNLFNNKDSILTGHYKREKGCKVKFKCYDRTYSNNTQKEQSIISKTKNKYYETNNIPDEKQEDTDSEYSTLDPS